LFGRGEIEEEMIKGEKLTKYKGIFQSGEEIRTIEIFLGKEEAN
jgi:hypothetical protein